MKPALHTIFRLLGAIILSLIVSLSFAQQLPNYDVLYHYGKRVLPENIDQFIQKPDIKASEIVNGRYYRLVQFYEVPDQSERQRITEAGIEILDYLPHYAYLLSIPKNLEAAKLNEFSIRSVVPVTGTEKIHSTLIERPFGDWATKGSAVRVDLQFYKNIPLAYVLNQCARKNVPVIQSTEKANYVRIVIPEDRIEAIAILPFVQFMALIPAPGEKEDIEGRSLHRANAIDSDYPMGRKYTGDGIGVHCRDDGTVGPHIDFQGRIFQLTDDETGTHGDGVSGIMAGAGNLNPANRGMAAGADLYVTNYTANFLDTTLGLHLDAGVKVTNSSYSNGCNDGYTIITQTVDQQMYDYPTYLHVFSSGNSNNNDCGYGAGDQWGNITGGHKQGKNVIATANLFANAALVNSSSRGPAHDGRIKPDIAANGQDQISTNENNGYLSFGGTSGAAPGIAGIAAQLMQAYKELNNSEEANAGLIKACLLNTANDLGNEGPDFRYGWGHVNALRAVKVIEQNAFLQDAVGQGNSNTHEIDIPNGTKELRVMVYWTDPAATPMTSKALVNDLNMQVTTPGGDNLLPWLLDPTPNPGALNSPATNGIDDLNNVEQVLIKAPQEGSYSINIEGFEVPFGPQEYFVVYEIITDEITVTYPIGGESFEPFTTERIHWDAFGDDGDFTLEYSIDEGATWNTITTVSGNTRMYNWSVPGSTTGQAKIRVTRGNVSDESEANFSISYVPANIAINQVCPDYVRIVWPPVFGANEYDVFILGDKYMDSIGTTIVPLFDIPVQFPLEDFWFAVRAKGDNGLVSRRSIAINYDDLLLDCQQNNDLALSTILTPNPQSQLSGCDPYIDNISITITNEGLDPASDFPVAFRLNDQAPVTEVFSGTLSSGESVDYVFSTPVTIDQFGINTITTWVGLADEEFIANDTASLAVDAFFYTGLGNGEALDVIEDFEGPMFPQDFWQIINPDDFITWEKRDEIIGIDNDVTDVLSLNFWSYGNDDNIGQIDYFQTTLIDLTDATLPALNFDYAYTFWSGGPLYDSLKIEISTDCGLSFDEVLFYDGGESLATVPGLTVPFSPTTESDWASQSVNLVPYISESVIIRFTGINGWGNNLYLDNINISNIVAPNTDMNLADTLICENQQLQFIDNSTGVIGDYSWNFGPGTSPESASGPGPHDVYFLDPGVNTVTLIASNAAGSDTSTIDITVEGNPIADFTSNDLGDGVIAFTNNSEFGISYLWDFGDGNSSMEENPTHTYSENGNYTVTLTVTNACGEKVAEEQLGVTVVATATQFNPQSVKLLPNPTSGDFQIQVAGFQVEPFNIAIYDIRGRLIQTPTIKQYSARTQTTFDINGTQLVKGVYLIKVSTPDGLVTKKLVVQ